MKNWKRFLIMALAVIMAGSTLVGCRDESIDEGKAPDDADPAKTIRVERLRDGYGDDWLNDIKAKYEAAFPGYYVDLKPSTNDMGGDTVARQLYRGYSKNGNIDLFVTGNVYDNMIDTSNSYVEGSALVEDLTDIVLNQKAIGPDGKDEDKTVMEKMHPSMSKWLTNGKDRANYGMPYINSIAGLAVNVENLAKFGYTEMPRTTNELIEMATNIYLGKKADGSAYSEGPATQSYMYPFTYYSGAQYGGSYYHTAVAQQDMEFFDRFRDLQEKDGTPIMDGYELYRTNKDILQGPLEMLFFSYDTKLAARGSTTATLDEVQAKLVSRSRDRAVFMWNGDWVLNEVNKNFAHSNEVLDFINVPILSSIGTEVFDGKNAEEADELLSYVVKLVDQNMDIADIIADVKANKGYDLTEAQATRIAEARGIYYSRAIEHRAFIPKDTPKKDLAAKFLRFIAGEGGAQSIAEKAAMTSVFATEENKYSDVSFVKNASKLGVSQYNTPIRFEPTGFRNTIKLTAVFYTQGEFLNKLWAEGTTSMFANGQLNGSSWEAVYAKNASDRLDAVYTLFKDNWATKLEEAGITQ